VEPNQCGLPRYKVVVMRRWIRPELCVLLFLLVLATIGQTRLTEFPGIGMLEIRGLLASTEVEAVDPGFTPMRDLPYSSGKDRQAFSVQCGSPYSPTPADDDRAQACGPVDNRPAR
jgi:hypothetical protein